MTDKTKPYEYFAFISYKREDEKWAKWLQKKLESYSLPTAIRKENPELPNKIRPVFRDQSELSGGNLKAEIERGLNGSKYLIVICSPRSAKSPWVSKEVQHFIDQGREEYIIPFIIGGSPNAANPEDECFPEGLRLLRGEKEILGININEMGRNAAAIKVIARMFDLRFDTLWQRFEKEKRQSRLFIGMCAVVLVALSLGITGYIARQNTKLNIANEKVIQQRDSIYNAYEQLKEENLTAFNRRINPLLYHYVGSIRVEDDGYPEVVAFSPKEPLIAYADVRGYWLHNIKTNIEHELTPDNGDLWLHLEDCEMEFSKDGSELLIANHNGLLIWDIASIRLKQDIPWDKTDEFIRTKNYKDRFSSSNSNYEKETIYDEIKYIQDLNIYFRSNNGSIEILDAQKKIICKTRFKIDSFMNSWEYQRIPKQNELLIIGEDKAIIYNGQSKNFTQYFKGYPKDKFFFSNNGNFLCVGNEIYTRKLQIDTIRGLSYKLHPIKSFPKYSTVIKTSEPILTVDADENTIILHNNGTNLKIKVLKTYNTGNGIPKLQDAILCGKEFIVAIVADGYLKIFNLRGEYMGYLEYPYWMSGELGGECGFHGCVDVVFAKFLKERLYTISQGGVLRIYNLSMQSIEKVVELPRSGDIYTSIEKVALSDDQSRLYYTFYKGDQYFDIEVP